MHWSEMENTQPRLAGLGRQRLVEPGVVLVATIRQDGTPRLSPVEPFVMDGDLWLSMMWQSRKARDLRGTARAENDPAMERRYADAVAISLGWRPEPGQSHLFAVGINEITFIRYDNATGPPPAWENPSPSATSSRPPDRHAGTPR